MRRRKVTARTSRTLGRSARERALRGWSRGVLAEKSVAVATRGSGMPPTLRGALDRVQTARPNGHRRHLVIAAGIDVIPAEPRRAFGLLAHRDARRALPA